MDYIYGKLNKEVERVSYKGGQTQSATVFVDNATNTIYVDTQSSVVDSTLNNESTNAVQNKVVSSELARIEKNAEETNAAVVNALLTYDNKLSKLSDSVDAIKENVIASNAQYTESIAAINTTIATQTAEIEKLKSLEALSGIQSQVDANTLSIGILNDKLVSDVASLSEVDAELQASINSVRLSVTEETAARQLALQSIESELSSIKNDVKSVQALIEETDVATQDQLDAISASVTSRINELSDSITLLSSVVSENNEDTTDSLSELDIRCDNLSASIEELRTYINTYVSETFEADIQSINDELTAIKSDIESHSDDINKLREDTEHAIVDTENTLRSDLQDLSDDLNDAKSAHTTLSQELQSAVDELEGKISQLDRNTKTQIENVNKSVTDSLAEAKAYTDECVQKTVTVVSSVESLVEELSTEFDAHSQDQLKTIAELRIADADNEMNISKLSEETAASIFALDNTIKSIQNSLRGTVADVLDLMGKVDTNTNNISEINSDVRSLRSYIDNSIGQVNSTISSNYSDLNNKIATLNRIIGYVNLDKDAPIVDQIEHLHGELAVAQTQLSNVQDDIVDEVRKAIDKIESDGIYVVTNMPDKVGQTTVYAATKSLDADGSEVDENITINAAVNAEGNSVIIRDGYGNVTLPDDVTTKQNNAVHKKYVDTLIETKTSSLEDAIMAIINERFLIIDGGTSADLSKS